MMIIGELYNEMFERELTNSMRSWSEAWAGRSHNFATTCWDKPLPAETAIHLRRKLLAEGHPDLAAKVLLALLGEEHHAQ
jgi:hypothetical protein